MITQIGYSNANLDLASNRITFLDARFYQTEEGGFVPSVTTILEAYPKGPEYYAWLKRVGEDADDIRDEAGRRGSTVHWLTEQYDKGEEVNLLNGDGYLSYKMNEWAMFERYVEFRSRYPFDVIHSELNIVSAELGYAGTLDRVIELNGKTYIVDTKTSNAIYPSYWLQLAAYRQLFLNTYGLKVDGVAILWLNAKTRTNGSKGQIQGPGWQLISRDDTSKDMALFEATRSLWLAEHGGSTPKMTSYSLSHQLK